MIISMTFGIGKESRVLMMDIKRANRIMKQFSCNPTIQTIREIYKGERENMKIAFDLRGASNAS